MQENFLNYIWKNQLFTSSNPFEEDNSLLILKAGILNTDAGPDFSNVEILLEKILFKGTVEIHIKSSDWNLHKHQENALYNNVILHVVYENDVQVFREDKTKVLTIELKDKIDPKLIQKHDELVLNTQILPCHSFNVTVSAIDTSLFLERKIIERLENKSKQIIENFNSVNDWKQVFYITLFQSFGFSLNAEPMRMIISRLPYKLIEKHQNSFKSIESILFGIAGFLESDLPQDDLYFEALKIEFNFLKHKYKLDSIDKINWKFLRTRPQNFPTVRLAQLSSILHVHTNLYQSILEINSTEELKKYFLEVDVSNYWEKHYDFGKTKKKPFHFGKTSFESIIINCIVPYLFAYGQHYSIDNYCQKAIDILDELKFEKNKITQLYLDKFKNVKSARDSQALIQLHKSDCQNKKCLSCIIGINYLKNE